MKEDSLGGACAAAHYSSLDKKDSNMMNMDKAIQISWSSPKINEEHLVHHFTDHRMGGGKIQNMKVNLDDKTAVIEFINDKGDVYKSYLAPFPFLIEEFAMSNAATISTARKREIT